MTTRLDDEHVSEIIAHGQTGDHGRLSECQHLVFLLVLMIFDIDKVQRDARCCLKRHDVPLCRLEFGLGGRHLDSHQDLHRKLWQETLWDRRAEHGWAVVVGRPGGNAQDWAV